MERKKISKQKDMILTKSSSLFWEKGYTETSMKDIAQACGFRPANIYNFFDNKESILLEILQDEMEEILTPLKGLENDEAIDPKKGLHMVIEHHVRLTLGEKRSSKLLFDAGLKNLSTENRQKIIKLRDDYNRIGIAIIRKGIKQGVFKKMDEKLIVYSIASIIARSRIWYSPEGKYTVDEIIDFIYNFSLNGLGAGQGAG